MSKNFRSYRWQGECWETHKERDTFAGFWEKLGLKLAGKDIEGRANTAQRKGKFAIVLTVRKHTDLLNAC